ncbi:uncharacterized protein LOC119572970 isoform X2 [Penaeus monodon]|uniref:uncharacterized protein LOC119572970 isoform X2 n=1 Tax=Penaeus monodon TaxID=6687 RepID=UPI0018A6D6D5|nr:uncharacterized protein LOC119572970 isoform X2 [Penaeus monodon]
MYLASRHKRVIAYTLVLVTGMAYNILQIISYVAKGLNMIIRIQDNHREPARDNTQIDEALQIIQRQQSNIDQLIKDQRQQEQVMERLLALVEKMDGAMSGSSAMNSNSMQNVSLVLNLPEDSQDCNSIVHSLYWTLRNNMNHSQRSVTGGDSGRRVLQLTNAEDNMTRLDSFVQDSCYSFEKVSAMFQCDRCNNKFDKEKRQPLVLSECGHTYCRICIQESSQDRFMCPKCSIISRDLEDLPINRTLYQILDAEGRGEDQGYDPAGSPNSFAAGLPAGEEEEERQAMLEQLRRIRGAESEGEDVPEGADGDGGLSLKNLNVSDDEGGACGFSDAFHTEWDKEWARKKLEEENERDEAEQEEKRQRRLEKRMIRLQRIEQEQLELALALSESLQEAQRVEQES